MLELVGHLSDEQVGAAYGAADTAVGKSSRLPARALETKGRPTVVLAHTVKAGRLGERLRGLEHVTHSEKKMQSAELKASATR